MLKRLIGAGVPRGVLLAGKATSTGVVVVAQTGLLVVLALLLGWQPAGDLFLALAASLLGVAAFAGLGLLVGGLFKAEIVLGLANLLWLVFVVMSAIDFTSGNTARLEYSKYFTRTALLPLGEELLLNRMRLAYRCLFAALRPPHNRRVRRPCPDRLSYGRFAP